MDGGRERPVKTMQCSKRWKECCEEKERYRFKDRAADEEGDVNCYSD